MFLKKLSLVVFVVFIFERVVTSEFLENICLDRGHIINHSGDDNCCKNQSVTAGIGTSAQWVKCAVPPTDDDESYVDTMWRIYICMLKMVMPKGQETISLIEFGKAMTTEYPETLKTEINEKLKDNTSQDNEAGVDFKNIEMIDQLRVNYFDVEKQICGTGMFGYYSDEINMTGRGCSFLEEILHRGGNCCNNKSLPIYDLKYQDLMPQNCNNTLSKFKEKLETMNSTHLNSFLYECEASCQLIQNGVISVEDLISFKVTDDIPIKEIVKEFTPKYYSKMLQKKILNHAKTNFSAEGAVVDVYSHYSIDETETTNVTLPLLPVEIHGCAVHNKLHELVFQQIRKECVRNKENFYS